MPQHYTTRIFCRRLLLIFVGPFLAAGWFFCEYWTVLSQTIQSNFLPVAFRSLPIPIPERLLITEVLYDPVGAEPGCEWVEIYNAEDHKIQLGGYKIGDAPSPGSREGMLRFPESAVIDPGQVMIVASQAVCFAQAYGRAPNFELDSRIPGGPAMVKYMAWAAGNVDLSNTGDEVLILDEGDRIVDAVSWGDSRAFLDPPARRVDSGHSLERNPAYRDTGTAADWIDQPQPAPWNVDLSTPTPKPSPTFVNLTPSPGAPVDLLISEVLYDPLGAEPDQEWVEIFNAGEFPVSLSEYKIGDEETRAGTEGMYRFPAGATIAPGKAVVISNQAKAFSAVYGFYPDYELNESEASVPNLEKYMAWASGSMELVNTGDEVLILGPGDTIIDALSWGNSNFAFDPPIHPVAPGHSLERWPAFKDTDSAADWSDQAASAPGNVGLAIPSATPTLTPTSSPAPTSIEQPTFTPTLTPLITATATDTPTPTATQAPAGHLLISEVMYDPAGVEPSSEWIEIYNPTGATIDLSSFKIGNAETSLKKDEGMLQFPAGSVISPGQVIVIANQATVFQTIYNFLPDYEMNGTSSSVPHLEKYAAWSTGSVELGNYGDEVLILDGSDAIVDLVAYGVSPYAGFQPPVLDVVEGHSIERCPVSQDTDSAADWVDQATPGPGQIN